MKSSKRGKAFIAAVLALAIMLSMNTAAFASSGGTEMSLTFILN